MKFIHRIFSAVSSSLQLLSSKNKDLIADRADSEADSQILSELATAAEAGMVATRSQEFEIVPEIKEPFTEGITRASAGKRKTSADSSVGNEYGSGSKRVKGAAMRSSTPNMHETSTPRIPIVAPTPNNFSIPRDGIEVRISKTSGPQLSRSVSPKVGESVTPMPSSPKEEQQITVAATSTHEQQHPRLGASPLLNITEAENQISQPKPNRKHKRFGREEPSPEALTASNGDTSSEVRDRLSREIEPSVESDDEAPEIVTASASLVQARSVASEAAKTIGLQKANEKQKRRDRDARLKIQAKLAERSRKDLLTSTPEADSPSTLKESINGPLLDSGGKPKNLKKIQVPILLPDEILNAEPTEGRLTSNKEFHRESHISKKRKLLDVDSRPPKDIRRGPLTIRVLHSGSSNMPPKVSKESSKLREAWLTGQRGSRGGIARRKVSRSFVRR